MHPIQDKRASATKVVLTASLATTLLTAGLLLGFSALATEAPTQATASVPSSIEPEVVSITVPGAGTFGGDVAMETEVYKPSGPGPFPTLIYSHGRAADRLDRGAFKKPIPAGHVRYWLTKGFAIVAPIRVGYGVTGGPDREDSGAWFDNSGNCTHKPDFQKLAKVTAEATLAAIKWTQQKTWADKDHIVLEGRSVGGFGTVATAAAHPAGVIGYINFSGGGAGSPDFSPNRSCDPDQMRDVMAQLGKTTTIPGLWLYAENDRYWGPEAPRQWYNSFAQAGSPAEFVNTGELPGRDGHLLMFYGGKLWSVHVDRFVKQLGL